MPPRPRSPHWGRRAAARAAGVEVAHPAPSATSYLEVAHSALPATSSLEVARPAAFATSCVVALIALLTAAGCAPGGGEEEPSISGKDLKIYSSLPLQGPSAADGKAILEGEQLAL